MANDVNAAIDTQRRVIARGALQPAGVAALVSGDIELPSDYDGVVYISLDHGNWRGALAKELLAAGFQFDARLAL